MAAGPRPVVLSVMDGYGINPRRDANAVAMAAKPNLDRIEREWPHTQIATSGPAVGLPEGQMGNSEVGHLNIGAGVGEKPASWMARGARGKTVSTRLLAPGS